MNISEETADMLIRKLLEENAQLRSRRKLLIDEAPLIKGKVTIRQAIKIILGRSNSELTSREINHQLRRVPLLTRSQNLHSLVQTTLGEMKTQHEIRREGRRGRMKYALIRDSISNAA